MEQKPNCTLLSVAADQNLQTDRKCDEGLQPLCRHHIAASSSTAIERNQEVDRDHHAGPVAFPRQDSLGSCQRSMHDMDAIPHAQGVAAPVSDPSIQCTNTYPRKSASSICFRRSLQWRQLRPKLVGKNSKVRAQLEAAENSKQRPAQFS